MVSVSWIGSELANGTAPAKLLVNLNINPQMNGKFMFSSCFYGLLDNFHGYFIEETVRPQITNGRKVSI